MINSDKNKFVEILTTCSSIYRQEIETPAIKVFWSLLSGYEINEVEAAFYKYMSEGRFMPTPAEIIARISSTKKHVDKNEAWAICSRLATEEDTAIITAQMRDAWAISYPIYEAGDKVGARMAFIETYERLVAFNPEIHWEVQGGSNKSLKQHRVEEAVRIGRLSEDHLLIHQHSDESIGFESLTNQLLLNVDTPSREKLKRNWNKVKKNLKQVNDEDHRAMMREIEREFAEQQRDNVLRKAQIAMDNNEGIKK